MFWPFQTDNGIETVLHPNSSIMHSAFSNRFIHKSFDFWLSLKIPYLYGKLSKIGMFDTRLFNAKIHSHWLTNGICICNLNLLFQFEICRFQLKKASNNQGDCLAKNRKKIEKEVIFFVFSLNVVVSLG